MHNYQIFGLNSVQDSWLFKVIVSLTTSSKSEISLNQFPKIPAIQRRWKKRVWCFSKKNSLGIKIGVELSKKTLLDFNFVCFLSENENIFDVWTVGHYWWHSWNHILTFYVEVNGYQRLSERNRELTSYQLLLPVECC